MAYRMTINNKGRAKVVADYAEASKVFLAEQERIGYQGTADSKVWPRFAHLRETKGGPVIAHVSQNGRVWAGLDYVAGAVPLCEPVREAV